MFASYARLVLCGFVPAFALTLYCLGGAKAQTQDAKLAGLKNLEVVVEQLPPDARTCGLSQDNIRNSILFPLTTAGLNVSERPDIELYVNLNITYSSKIDLCAGALNMEVDAYKKLQFSFSDRPKTYEVNLWHYGSILTSIQNTFRQRAMDEIESEAKKFVIDWKLDNQK